MGGVLDFLFEGNPPPSVTTYGSNVTNVPSWLSDYTQGLLARANSVAAEPYQPYSGPRIAGFTPQQVQAQNMASSNVGAWKGSTDAASGAYNGVLGGPGALSKASPYLTAGSGSYTDQVKKYMDPYVQNVIDRSTQLANRNLTDKLLPSINSNFIRSGAYGSAAQQRAVGNALRDTTSQIQTDANAALSDAYRSGSDIYSNEANRNLQAGQTAGALYGQDMSNKLQAGSGLGSLGQYIASLNQSDLQGLAASGADQQGLNQKNLDLSYQDFQNQRDYPKNQVGWMNSIINGLPNMGSTQTTQNQNPASAVGPNGISQIGSLLALYNGVKGLWSDGDGGDDGEIEKRARGGLARYAEGGPLKRLGYRATREYHDAPYTFPFRGPYYAGAGKRAPIEGRRPGDPGDRMLRRHGELQTFAHGGLATIRRLRHGR